jgi:transcriptional regulator with XRE-family HTH domain
MVIGVAIMNIKIGEKLKQARRRKGLTLRDTASRLNIDHSYLSRIENDHKVPSLELLEMLANFYGVPIAELFIDDNNKSESDSSQHELNEILDTLKQMQRSQISEEWLEMIEYCQKENLNPKDVLDVLKTIVGIAKELK